MSNTTSPPARICRVAFDSVHPIDVPMDVDLASDAFFDAVVDAQRAMAVPVARALCAFGDERLDGVSALLLHGVDVGDVGVTPSDPTAGRTERRSSELWLLAIARMLGQPIGYRQEHGGNLVQNLVPVRAHAQAQTSTSSTVTLAWHTETAFHPHRPRWVVLLALRGDRRAGTLLADVRDVVAHLDEDDLQVLRQARFVTGIDASFGSSTTHSGPGPVLWGSETDPRLWFDADLMRGTDPRAQAALGRVVDAIDAVAHSIVLEAGDCLIIDNTRAAHGRTLFTPRYDGTDRWLQRALVVSDLASSAGERTGRVITTAFP